MLTTLLKRSAANPLPLVPAITQTSNQTIDVHVLSGAPSSITRRPVRIYRPSRTAMQSGTHGTRFWRLDFDVQQRWNNKLMGWSSSADTMQALALRFRTSEEAVRFAEKQGFDYEVIQPNTDSVGIKTYADNFKYSKGPLKYHHTK